MIEYFSMLSDEIYISCFNGMKIFKERSTTLIKKNDNIEYVIIEVLESPYLGTDKKQFNLNLDLVKNEKINYFLENKDNISDKINHCEILFIGKKVITGEREYKDSVYVDISVYYFQNAL